jgi:NSS family neurotransmitter:Na+ symporter
VAAGCAIGIGNVWRFPFITGEYGGAAFVAVYLVFLVILGLPILVAELAMGRASRLNLAGAMRALEPKGSKWHIYGYIGIVGNLLLMMYYTTVSGWFFAYLFYTASGSLEGLTPAEVEGFFDLLKESTPELVGWMALVVVMGFAVCSLGLQKGVERIVKIFMTALFVLMIVLVIKALTLPGAGAGISFYLKPDFANLSWEGVFAAMGQAFFTLSLGIGCMTIFGSYIRRERTLAGESINIILLDTIVALMAGMIIFPACAAFKVPVDKGPGLVFVTLPNVFNDMVGGRVWGALFFLFMVFASMTTVIAVFENLVAFSMDEWHLSRKSSSLIGGSLVFLTSLPCILGFGPWGWFQPFGSGTALLDLEDFILSYNFLPIGSLIFLLFCTFGWGWDRFLNEANSGDGIRFPSWMRAYMGYVLPAIILFIFVVGYLGV